MELVKLPENPPGIDLQKGIENWEDDWEDYFYVLNMFAERRHTVADDVASLLQSGGREQALELVHAVKGASGNLLLTPTFESAGALEKVLRDADQDAREPLRLFREALEQALDSIGQLPKVEDPDGDDDTPLDRERAKVLIETLAVMFQDGVLDESFTALLHEATVTLRAHAGELVETLKRQASEFDFDDALGTLKLITDKLELELNGTE